MASGGHPRYANGQNCLDPTLGRRLSTEVKQLLLVTVWDASAGIVGQDTRALVGVSTVRIDRRKCWNCYGDNLLLVDRWKQFDKVFW